MLSARAMHPHGAYVSINQRNQEICPHSVVIVPVFPPYVFSLCLPESMTNTTSSIVMDDSAMFVAITTLR